MHSQLTKEFLKLTPYDRITLLTLHLRGKRQAMDVVKRIDRIGPRFTAVYFGYEILEGL